MKTPLPAPEQRSRRDLIGVLAVIVVFAVIIGASWLASDQRKVEHRIAEPSVDAVTTTGGWEEKTIVPTNLEELWQRTAPVVDAASNTPAAPIVEGSGVLTAAEDTLIMRDVHTGEEKWRYGRGLPLCDVVNNFKRIIAIYEGPKGCGDVVSLDRDTGQYAHTRSAINTAPISPIVSNDVTGTISPERVELWRSDLVRTVEVGWVPTPVRKDAQDHEGCRFTSALTRKSLLATQQQCPGSDTKLLRLLETKPERSDTPEKLHEFTVPAGSELLSIGQDRAAVYAPNGAAGDGKPQLIVASEEGEVRHFPIREVPAIENNDAEVYQPATADLPHYMTAWTGSDLVGFSPSSQKPAFTISGALGTGDMFGQRLLVPVAEGIAVYDPTAKKVLRTIDVDRGDYEGPVRLAVSDGVVVEQRGGEIIALGAAN